MQTGGGDAWCNKAERGERGFSALGFLVESESDLEDTVKQHGTSENRELDTPQEVRPEIRLNTPAKPTRFTEPHSTRRLGPIKLYRLGYLGLYVKDYMTSAEWREKTLGFKISDSMHVLHNPELKVVAFLRKNRGEEWVNHLRLRLFRVSSGSEDGIAFSSSSFARSR